jgi:hypothetical protein
MVECGAESYTGERCDHCRGRTEFIRIISGGVVAALLDPRLMAGIPAGMRQKAVWMRLTPAAFWFCLDAP